MIKHVMAIMALVAATAASAQVVGIERETLGSGTPGTKGFEVAQPVLENDIFHAPQYLSNYPTAATIWPRVVEVPCTKTVDGLKCRGYEWQPKYGRGEYLFFKPVIEEAVVAPPPQIIVVPGPTVLKEVPVKKKRE